MPVVAYHNRYFKAATITNICAFLVILLFEYTGLSKLLEHDAFYVQLVNMPLIGVAAAFLSYALPIFEILLALALVIPAFRLLGFYISALLFTLFTMYLLWMIMSQVKLPCSCGGVISKLSWQQHFVFNLFFIGVSLIGIKFQKRTIKAKRKLNFLSR